MLIFNDLTSGKEMFSDAYKMGTFGENGCILTWVGKMETRSADSIQIDGANPSAEEQEEALEDGGVSSGIDICLNHDLKDVSEFFSKKKDLQSYLKKWAKSTAKKLEDDEEGKKAFMNGCKEAIQTFANMYDPDNCSVYSVSDFENHFGEGNVGVAIGVWSDDGKEVIFHAIKAGLVEEKC